MSYISLKNSDYTFALKDGNMYYSVVVVFSKSFKIKDLDVSSTYCILKHKEEEVSRVFSSYLTGEPREWKSVKFFYPSLYVVVVLIIDLFKKCT